MMFYLINYFVVFWIILSLQQKVTTFAASSDEDDKPEFEGLRECPPGSDEELNACIKLLLEETRPFISNGIPQIGLQPLDPLRIKEIPIRFGNGTTAWFNYKWINVQVRGFANYTKGDVIVNTKKKTIRYEYFYPKLVITADYERGGQFLVFPLTGAGKVKLDVSNFHSFGTVYLQVVQRPPGSEPILRIRAIKFDSTVEDIKSDLPMYHSSFTGRIVNEFISQNAKWIYEDFVKPAVAKHMEQYMIKHSTLPKIMPASYFIN